MPSLKGPTITGVLASGGVLLGFAASLLLIERTGHAEPQAAPAGSAAAPASSAGPAGKAPLPPLPTPAPAGAAAPAGSAVSAPPAAPAGSAAAPGAVPPPYMYQEPWSPPEGQRAAPSGQPGPLPVAAPGQYVYDPPPPAPPMQRAPFTSLFVGARVGALFPFGNAYDTDPYYNQGEKWDWLATGGPVIEGDVGVRFARSFIVYGFWEHAWMGKGSDPSWRTPPPSGSGFGDQQSATTDFTGLGFRWSSRPSTIGFLLDLGLGYRWFHEKWSSGAKMDLSGFGEFRVGAGADIRLNQLVTLTPLLSLSFGSFGDREVLVPGKGRGDIAGSYSGSHGTTTLSIGGNFDLFGSM
ncbi:MAG: hypothetical protein ABW133_17105 [Polyangiaceae bacterium]